MKTLNKFTILVAAIAVTVAVSFSGCKRDEAGMSRMQVRMIDAPSPYNYEAINIDVKGLQANIDGKWQDLQAKPGVYNILSLVNGHNVLLADATVPEGTISQLHLVLGNSNTIKVGGEVHALTIPNGGENGLQVDFDEPLPVQDHPLIIDFDAAHSVVNNGDGTYNLVPVLHVFTAETAGSIAGQVSPAGSGIAIVAIGTHLGFDNDQGENGDDDNDHGPNGEGEHHHHHHHFHNGHSCGYHHDDDQLVYSAYADPESGQFLLQGLEPGTYTVKIYPSGSDVAVVFYNVTVTEGGITSLGVITLP